jgi:hypothetical protein
VAREKEADMSRILLGIVCGLVFGAIDIGIMLSMSFPDKRAAITAAFIARFGIGFVIGASRLPWPGWAVGLFLGVLLSILQEEGSDFRVPTSLSMRERSDAEV